MILPLLSMIRSILSKRQSMEPFYRLHKTTRQGYHQSIKRLKLEEELMIKLTQKILDYRRMKDRRAGSRSLYYNLNIKINYNIGITKFEQLLNKYKLTLIPLSTKVVTTQSCFQSWNYTNLTNGLIINGLNQLVVGDITYVSLGKGRYYLFCLTDVFTMRVVGYCLSDRMRKEEALECLNMFINLRKRRNLKGCIHHTDGGGQYFSRLYLSKLEEHDINVSVARNCLENGLAEQKNGFIKNHLIPTMNLNSELGLAEEMKRVITNYNKERKQELLGWRSPIEFENYIKTTKKAIYFRLHDHANNVGSERHGF